MLHIAQYHAKRLFNVIKQLFKSFFRQLSFKLFACGKQLRRAVFQALGAENLRKTFYRHTLAGKVSRNHYVKKLGIFKAVFFRRRFIIITDEPHISRALPHAIECVVKVRSFAEKVLRAVDDVLGFTVRCKADFSVYINCYALALERFSYSLGAVEPNNRLFKRLYLGGYFVCVKRHSVHQRGYFKLHKLAFYLARIYRSKADIVQGTLYGNVRIYARKPAAKQRHFPAVNHVLPDLALYLGGVLEYAVKRAVLRKQRLCGFFAHSRNARNIVRGIAHKRLIIDKLRGGKAVLQQTRFVVNLYIGDSALCPEYARGGAYELKAVAVARNNNALVIKPLCKRTEYIVTLVALHTYYFYSHRRDKRF